MFWGERRMEERKREKVEGRHKNKLAGASVCYRDKYEKRMRKRDG